MQSHEVFQAAFINAVMDPETATPAQIVDPDGKPSKKRFDVYRNNVISSLLEAMSQAFPIVEKLVGSDFFRQMSRIYIRNNPPSSPLMMFYGENFPEFIEGFEPASSVPYLPDIARLEFARRKSYFAADAIVPPQGALAGIDPDKLGDLVLILHPALYLLSSRFPVFDIWKRNHDDEQHAISQAGQDVLIIRPRMEVHVQPAPLGTEFFVHQIKKGEALASSVELTQNFVPNADISQIIAIIIPHVITIKE